MRLEQLRARLAGLERAQHGCAPTGFAALDRALQGGLRIGALNELLLGGAGSGALEALLPALAHAQRPPRLLAWIGPERLPYPPALALAGFDLARVLLVRAPDPREHAWALDLVLRSGACDVVIAPLQRLDDAALRRLQLAAEATRALALLVRPLACAGEPSPAAVRLEAAPLASPDPRRRRLRVTVRRCRGGSLQAAAPIDLEWSRDPLDELEIPALRARAAPALRRLAARFDGPGDDAGRALRA